MDPDLVAQLSKEKDDREMQRYVEGKADKEFPPSLNLYNMGIKGEKLQSSTLHSVKYLN